MTKFERDENHILFVDDNNNVIEFDVLLYRMTIKDPRTNRLAMAPDNFLDNWVESDLKTLARKVMAMKLYFDNCEGYSTMSETEIAHYDNIFPIGNIQITK